MNRTEEFAETKKVVTPTTLQEHIEILLQGFSIPDEVIGRSIDISDVATESTAKYTDTVARNRHKQELTLYLHHLQKENTLKEQKTFVLPFCGAVLVIRNKKTSKKERRKVYLAPSPINMIKPNTKNLVIITPESPIYKEVLKKPIGHSFELKDQRVLIEGVLSPQEIESELISIIKNILH